EVERGARRPPRAGYSGIAEEVEVSGVGRGMDRDEQDVAAFPEDVLGTVAVVVVHVQQRDPRETAIAQLLRRQRRIVEVAVAAIAAARRMLSGRAAQRTRRTLAFAHD